MNELFKLFLSLTFSGSLLILAFLLCRPLLKDRVSRQWQYYIWLLVIARLLIPAAPQTNLVNSLYQSMKHTIEIPEVSGIQQQNKTDASPAGSPENDYENVRQNQPADSKVTAKEAWDLVKNSLWFVWLAGAFILFVRLLYYPFSSASRLPIPVHMP